MKKHFGKCVIERPRSGSSNPGRKARSFGEIVNTEDGTDYFGETKLPMNMNGRAHGYDSKNFTDVLGPLNGFLRSCRNRPWDDVYSEIKKTLGKSPWSVQHIVKDHLDVEKPWRGTDGRLYTWGRYSSGPIEIGRYRPDREFYVEPETGILRDGVFYREQDKRYKRTPPKPEAPLEKITLATGEKYEKINGIWYLIEEIKRSVRRERHPYHWIKAEKRACTGCSEVQNVVWYEEQIDSLKHHQLNKKELKSLRTMGYTL